jgi:cysteine/O-acetylserine efflux protein
VTAALTFALAMTFSPGPNNIMSASLGMMHGYPRALRFILGVVCGFAMVMLLGVVVSTAMLSLVPAVQPVLKYVGAAYITWLAWVTWSHREDFGQTGDVELSRTQGFSGGFALQFANPKAITYALVMFSTFLGEYTGDLPLMIVTAAGMAALAFLATSTWALAGAGIRTWLRTERQRAVAAGLLAAALVYTAIELAEIPQLLLG